MRKNKKRPPKGHSVDLQRVLVKMGQMGPQIPIPRDLSFMTPLQRMAVKLRAIRANQPKVTLKEAQDQAKRVMRAKR